MENQLKTPIKELIARYPKVGEILEEFAIGCVPCSVGTCLLSDIVEIHGLSPEDEDVLMVRIASVVSPGQKPAPPRERKATAARERAVAYSPPLKRLVDEHALIKRFLALIPRVVAEWAPASGPDRRELLAAAEFIRSYADRYHHAKEEDILFALFDPALEILRAMLEDHRRGRACVGELLDALDRGDADGVAAGLRRYSEILAEHIRKEDEILYPWMDRNLSVRQVGELFSRFRDVYESFREAGKKYESYVAGLEEKFGARSAEVIR